MAVNYKGVLMCKSITFLLVGFLTISRATAFEIDSESIKAYGIPCAITIGAGMALIKTNGVEIGAATCLAISAATFVNSPIKKARKIESKVEEFQNDFWMKVKANSDKNKEELSYFKDQVRKVLAKKVIESQLKIDERVVEYLNSEDFKNSVKSEMTKVLKAHYPAIDNVIKKSVQKNMSNTIEEITKKVTSNIVNTTYGKVEKDELNLKEEDESTSDKAEDKNQSDSQL